LLALLGLPDSCCSSTILCHRNKGNSYPSSRIASSILATETIAERM
jgi:hypothetical protein